LLKPGTLGKWATLAGNFGKRRSLSALARDFDRLGMVAKPGTLGKLAILAGNFGKSRTLADFINSGAPLLKTTAKMAAPMVSRAIGGPFGGMAARMLARMLQEGETELGDLHKLGSEFEVETELREGLHETVAEILNHELEYHEALAEMMAEAAEREQHEADAEALAGAAVVTLISPADQVALRQVLPHLVRGTAVLTRILRARPGTRPVVRALPTIVRRTVRTLKQHASAGEPITRRATARAAAREVEHVLGNPIACASAMANNVWAASELRAGCNAQRCPGSS
jgi:hypothetical protein